MKMDVKTTPLAIGRKCGRRVIKRAFAGETALEVLRSAEFGRGREVFGFNGGQFSSIDLLDAVLTYTGPARCMVATWTAAKADMTRAKEFLESGKILDVRWLVDISFQNRQPELCALLRSKFGDDSIRALRSHAKFMTVASEEWKVVIQTSMNLNQNKRLESFWVCDCPDLYGEFVSLVERVFEVQEPGAGFADHKNITETQRALGWGRKKRKLVAVPWAS